MISRILETGFSGSSIDHGAGIIDVMLESRGDAELVYDNITFNGKSMLSRSDNSSNTFYFMRHGIKLNQGGFGFESDALISIYSNGKEGVIVSKGAKVKLNGPGMNTVNFVPALALINSGDSFIEVQLPAGEFRFSSN